ncbi:MAG: cyclase, partial [Microcoleus sp. SIO2G3]|nr:cyclase [Microcoleus sp. SIO2G3]
LRGILTALAGGGLAYRAATSEKSLPDAVADATGVNKPIQVSKAVTISNKSPEELYNFWHDFENLPTFMKHLQSVTVIDQTRSHWVANAPLGQSVEWDADIIGDIPNQFIAWASAENADVENSGFVKFVPAPGDRGTEVHVTLEYRVPGGAVTATLAKLTGEEPEQQLTDDLHRFKQLLEAGEIATTEGQPSGRR